MMLCAVYETCITEATFFETGIYFVAGTVCKSIAHDPALELQWLIRPRFLMHEFKAAEFHATCSGDKILFPQQNFFSLNIC